MPPKSRASTIKRVPATVQLLETRLQNYDEEVRESAYKGIKKLGAPEEPLIDRCQDMLTHQNWYAQETAAKALGHCADAGSAVAAAKAAEVRLEHSKAHVRFVAGRALIHVVEQCNGDAADAEGAKEGAELAAAVLVMRLQNEKLKVRQNALDALSRMGGQVTVHSQEICALITDPEVLVRNELIKLVSRLGRHVVAGVDALARGLDHEDEPVRRAAKRALLELSHECGEEVAAAVTSMLQSESPVTRIAALDLLSSLRGLAGPHGQEIAEHLEETNSEVRLRAVYALVSAGKAVVPEMKHIKKRTQHKNQDVARAAIQALRGLAPQPHCSKIAKTVSRDLLEEPDAYTRRVAIEVLGGAGHSAVPFFPELTKSLEDKDWGIRRAAIEALADLEEHAEPAGSEVARRLLHANPDVRRAAGEALGRMGAHAGEFGHRVEGMLHTEEDPDVVDVLKDACELLYAAGMSRTA